MATTFHLYLKNKAKKNGEFPIYLRVTSGRTKKLVSTGVSVLKKFWNKEAEQVRKNHPNYKTLNQMLNNKLKEAQETKKVLTEMGDDSVLAIQMRLNQNERSDFFVLADELYNELKELRKLQASKNLRSILNKIEQFEGSRTLPLNKINAEYLDSFIAYLKHDLGNKGSTIKKNFESIREIFRRALKHHLILKNPFEDFKPSFSSKVQQKVKLTFEQIQAIEALEIKSESNLWHYRNAFLFSFYSGGIRFGDICCLKWENVQNGKLNYQMNKNEKSFSTQLNDFQLHILSFYEGELMDFVFPFLNNHKDYSDPYILRMDISAANKRINGRVKHTNMRSGLKKIAELAGIRENLSFHVARHSFAQYAVSEKGLSVYELMQTLRHSKLETTQRYLKSLNEEMVDKAMSKVF